jgi:phosphoglycolate phosphatase-like HAD superfamily hydrolase
MRSPVQHIIFDMDGTLTDTAKAAAAACNQAAERFGLPPFSEDAVRRVMGYPVPEFYHLLLPGSGDTLIRRFEAAADEAENRMTKLLGKNMLFGGVMDMLDWVSCHNIDMYIASTGSAEHVDLMLEVTGIRHFFTAVFCDRPRKVEMVAEIVGAGSAAQWLMLGDKHIDAQAAKQNGVLAVGAGYGYCGPEEEPLFDLIIRHPRELLELISAAP